MKLDGETLDEGQEIALRALLDVAQDRTVRPSLRIAAATTVLFPNGSGAYVEDDEDVIHDRAQEEATEDVYDTIAERVLVKLTPILERIGEKP